ncbi:MAG: nucleotidyltransferase family protein [Bacteroidales bacterium]
MQEGNGETINCPVIRTVVLAAGESVRTSRPKMLLPFGSGTLIEKVIDNISDSQAKSITVVLGAWQNEILKIISNLPVNYVINTDYKKGMLSSVICGIQSLPEETDAAIIFPGDYPFIPGLLLDEMIDAYSKKRKGIVIPVCKGRRGHPLLIDKKYFEEIASLDESKGLRSLSERYSADVFEYTTDNEMIFNDIDTIEDYTRAINKSI